MSLKSQLGIINILWTDAQDHGLAVILAIDELLRLCRRQCHAVFAKLEDSLVAFYSANRIHKVHLRRTDKSGNKQIIRLIV